ncbi:MAG: hypothetical protein HKN90_08145 [Flavobacteriaceae bacterium]|nr:hypothetical protein [Flavobacteriaceae bacterium]
MSSQFLDIPIYRKALEIRMLSVSISHYLQDDLCQLKEDGSEDQDIYFSGDIVQQSSALAPEIVNAEKNRHHSKRKYYHIKAIYQLTKVLYKNTKRLEVSNSNGKDYLKLLQRELKIFKSLQRKWLLTL